MRVYAMLLGVALTGVSGFAAELAVTSIGPGHAAAAQVGPIQRGVGSHLDTVWYGGVLDPVTVEARGDAPAKSAITRRRLLDRSAVRCPPASRRV